MSLPVNRLEFARHCLRKLGAPVVRINMAPEQIEDCVDEAILFWREYHFDASFKTFVKYRIEEADRENGYITLPENVQHVVKVYPLDAGGISTGIFSLRYQLQLNDLYDLSSASVSDYVLAQQYINTIQNVLNPESAIRFQRHMNRLMFDADFKSKYPVSSFLLIELMMYIDEDEYPDVWKDRALTDLATAYMKRTWGQNLKKFSGVQLPGGTTLNGQQIYDEAMQEIREREESFQAKFEEPIDFVMA